MPRTHDNWERLVAATLRREELWQLFHSHSRTPSVSSRASDFSFRTLPPDFPFDFANSTSWYPRNSALGVEASRWGYDANGSEDEPIANGEKPQALKPEEIVVNGKPLGSRELTVLQSCPNPPKRLKPGQYWYDKYTGFWGKQGQKPSQIISSNLDVGGRLHPNASNGKTLVFINDREITRVEMRLLKFVGVKCSGDTRFWMYDDGRYELEGTNNILGNIWYKAGARLLSSVLSLPFPSKPVYTSGEQSMSGSIILKDIQKLLLIGCNGSGTSTIFKQALFLYKDIPFLGDEMENIKLLIQSNVFRYICMLEEVRGHFNVENLGNQSDDERLYTGTLHSFPTSLSQEYAPVVEELWGDPAFWETVQQRSESEMLPNVANYFLDRVVDIFKPDYQPSRMDILYAEGFPSSLSFMDFSLTQPQDDDYYDSYSGDRQTFMLRYQLIRPPAKGFGDNYKWLEIFEGVRIVIFSISLSEYDQLTLDDNGASVNKMMFDRKLFESTITHSSFNQMHVLLLLTKYDLFEKKIEQVPLKQCDWFEDFDPVKLSNGTVSQLAHKGFEYISVKFKRLYTTLTGRKLYVTQVNSLDQDSVDAALKYAMEILKWDEEMNEYILSSDYSSEDIFDSEEEEI